MKKLRVNAYIDGFNLYHSIDDLGRHDLKWVNLRTLCEHYAPSSIFLLNQVFYFSAYATWLPDAYHRHRQYVKALEAVGVIPILGNFKEKRRRCHSCGAQWIYHEEKETDVNIGLYMMMGAFRDEYDRALLISRDSDLASSVRTIRREFPDKQIRLITPVGRSHSMDLYTAVGNRKRATKMKLYNLERSLFPKEVCDSEGRVAAVRPTKYDTSP